LLEVQEVEVEVDQVDLQVIQVEQVILPQLVLHKDNQVVEVQMDK
tara:strand:+ start:315 stop:449 length:135 start_codon:yes stop_codon:yes gene_type:complete